MAKRLFQVLDEINQLDAENNSRLLAVSSNFISADKVKQGAKICMGADEQSLIDIMTEDVIPILLLVNKKKYNELK